MSDHKIPGPALCGFSETFFQDEVGAARPAARPPAQKPTAASAKKPVAGKPGKGMRSGVPRNQSVSAHKKTLQAGRVTAAKAVNVLSKGKTLLKRHKAKPPVPVQVGAAVRAKLPPKAQAALRRQNDAAKRSQAAASTLAKTMNVARQTTIELAKALKKQRAVSKALRGPSKKTHLGFEEFYTLIGAEPDPNNPGYLTDGSPDPGYGVEPSMDMDFGADSPMDTPVELPEAPSMDTVIADMAAVGGIPYNGEKGWPRYSKGSYIYFYGPQNQRGGMFGMVWGWDKMNWPGSGDPIRWIKRYGQAAVTGNDNWDDGFGDDAGAVNASAANDPRNNNTGMVYGPIIGNPAMKDFAGMRFDSKGRAFWLPQEAPEWITFPLRQAAALTAQAEQKAAAAAAQAEAAVRAKEAADMAAEQARQEAANALAESQAASQAAVTSTQQETQAQQELVEQAKADREAQIAAAQQERQAGELILAQARRRDEYLAKHPELEFAEPGPGDGSEGPGDEGPRDEGPRDEGPGTYDDYEFQADEGDEYEGP